MKVHPIKYIAAINSGMLSAVLVSHSGALHSSLAMIATPETPPVTMLAGS